MSWGVKHQGGAQADGTGYFKVNDSGNFYAGNDEDLKIYHDGSNSYIDNTGTGTLYLKDAGTVKVRTAVFGVDNADGSEAMIAATADGDIKLFYDGSEKMSTASWGVDVQGTLRADVLNLLDNEKLKIGASSDLEVYHDGTNTKVINTTGRIDIETGSGNIDVLGEGGTEAMAKFIPSGAVELYHNNSKKFETDSNGVVISGVCDATCFTGDSGTSYGYSEITGSNQTVTTGWTQVDSNHEWDLPGAGVYKLQASVRIRIDDVSGWIAARYSGSAGNGHAQMMFESNDSDTLYNSSCHILWVYTATGADTVELQFKSSATSDGFSIQNDANGRNFMYWERIG